MTRSIRLSLALLGLTAFVPPTLAHANAVQQKGGYEQQQKGRRKIEKGLRTDQKGQSSFKAPTYGKLGGSLETYEGSYTVYQAPTVRRDPVMGHLTGVPLDAKVEVREIGTPKAIVLPEEQGLQRIASLSAAKRKIINREYNKKMKFAFKQAKETKPLFEVSKLEIAQGTPGDKAYAGQTVLIDKPVHLAAQSPVELIVKDKYNRTRIQSMKVAGQQRRTTNGNWASEHGQSVMYDLGGELAGTHDPSMQKANLLVSRPYINKDGVSVVRVFSAKAWGSDAQKVTILNRDTGESVPLKLNKQGGGSVEVPALKLASLRITAEHEAVPGKSVAAKKEYDLVAPDAGAAGKHHAKYERVEILDVK